MNIPDAQWPPLVPKAGVCQMCGEAINAYDSYWMDRRTNAMYCTGACARRAMGQFLLDHGFHHYTDG